MACRYPGRTHRFYTGTPVYKFGDGLSYTTFSHRLAVVSGLEEVTIPRSESAWDNNDVVATSILVHVTNTGSDECKPLLLHVSVDFVFFVSRSFECERSDWARVDPPFIQRLANMPSGPVAGDEVVLAFVSPPDAAVELGAPRRQLAAFKRVTLGVDETAALRLDITRRQLRVPAAAKDAASAEAWTIQVGNDGPRIPISVRFD